ETQYWRKRSLAYEPNAANHVRAGLNFAVPRLAFDEPAAVIKKVEHDSWHGTAVTCLVREATPRNSRELCIDSTKGLPLRERFEHYEWQYSDYSAFNGKSMPRQLDLTRDGKPYLAIRVEKAETVSIPDADFAAGPGFEA